MGHKRFIRSEVGSYYRKVLCVQEIVAIGVSKFNLTSSAKKIPKETIGKVHICTLSNPISWSSLNGDKFCGVKIGKEARLNADKACKERNAKLPQPRSKIAMMKFLRIFQSFRDSSVDKWIWLDMTDINKTGADSSCLRFTGKVEN